MKIYCQTNKQLISDNECVVRDSCEGCGHIERAKKNKYCPTTTINDVTPEEEREARHFETNYHFSDKFISDIPAECTGEYLKRDSKEG